ncbi:MAG: M20 family dipeptidase, partial [candidate division Zixibacteria bacterium]|nr:M20 family dipeptidase [candidate division Zixibacteria bacterium]
MDKNKKKRLDELFDFLRIPSVSAKSEYKKDILACAEWLSGQLNKTGIKSKIMPTGGHPVVYGEKMVSPDKLTILYYGHYDVQPPEPLDLWKTTPFEPLLEDGYIIARGATDDKGQVWTHVKALEAYLATDTDLPVNVKLLIEGEEEAGSENLEKFIKDNVELLKADIVVVSDSGQFGKDKPAVTYGLRGLAFVEVKITGPDRDLHSGSFGGSIANPINVLGKIIGGLHDENGKITIDGFYDDVIPLTDWEKKQFAALPFN